MKVTKILVLCLVVLLLLPMSVFANKNYAQMIEEMIAQEDWVNQSAVMIDGETIRVSLHVDAMDEGMLDAVQQLMLKIYDIYPFMMISVEVYVAEEPAMSFTTDSETVEKVLAGELTMEEWRELVDIVNMQTDEPMTVEDFEGYFIEDMTEETVTEEEVDMTEETDMTEEGEDMTETEDVSEPEESETDMEQEQGSRAWYYAAAAAVVAAVGGGGWWFYKKRMG